MYDISRSKGMEAIIYDNLFQNWLSLIWAFQKRTIFVFSNSGSVTAAMSAKN